jgi:hypothetical protein
MGRMMGRGGRTARRRVASGAAGSASASTMAMSLWWGWTRRGMMLHKAMTTTNQTLKVCLGMQETDRMLPVCLSDLC